MGSSCRYVGFDKDHEGYMGYTRKRLITVVQQSVPTDLILLYIGTNDFGNFV